MARNRALGAICTTMVQMAIVPNGEFVSAAGDSKGGRSVCKDAWNLELHVPLGKELHVTWDFEFWARFD